MRNKILAVIWLQLICHFNLMAEPADSMPVKITQPDGSQLTVQLIGDEFFHYYQTTDGFFKTPRDGIERRLPRGRRERGKHSLSEINSHYL